MLSLVNNSLFVFVHRIFYRTLCLNSVYFYKFKQNWKLLQIMSLIPVQPFAFVGLPPFPLHASFSFLSRLRQSCVLAPHDTEPDSADPSIVEPQMLPGSNQTSSGHREWIVGWNICQHKFLFHIFLPFESVKFFLLHVL